jgi:hypothetical protein
MMKKYCPVCEAPIIPDYYDDHDEEWCKCPECGEEGPAEEFDSYNDADRFDQAVDDWVHEWKIDNG